ncbi:MAG: efflux RND transporter periplasmic adaptor subunit [Planctomycetota bacterium]
MRHRTAIALVVLLAVAACGPSRPAGSAPRRPVPVQLTVAGTRELPKKAPVTGVLAAQEELVVGFEVTGRLSTLAVDVGDVVADGVVIAALAAREFELAVQRAKAAIVAAEVRLGVAAGVDLEGLDVAATPAVREADAVQVEAKANRARIAEMVQERLSSLSQLEAADATLAVAASRVQKARDEVATWLAEARLLRIEALQAEKRLADCQVRAPWPGRVAARHAAVGQVVRSGEPVLTLLRIDPLRLRLRVPDRLAVAEVAIGQAVEFTVDGAEGVQRLGRIVRAGAAIDRGDRTRLVEAEVKNPDGALLPGAFCRAQIVTAAAQGVVVVPRSAVVTFAGVHRVFAVEGSGPTAKAKGRLVQLGRSLGDEVEIVKGLDAGAAIVRDATGLTPEQPVVVSG